MGLPNIKGGVVRKVELRCTAGSSDKDYLITVAANGAGECRIYFAHGPHGQLRQGGEKTVGWVSAGHARLITDELVASKVAKQYLVVRDEDFQVPAQPAPSASAPAKHRPAKQVPPPRPAVALPAGIRAAVMARVL